MVYSVVMVYSISYSTEVGKGRRKILVKKNSATTGN